MEQLERIKRMENLLDDASKAVMQLSQALDDYFSAQSAIRELEAYYGSKDWKQDFSLDEKGLLPKDLKRGVLSEDGIWNILADNRALMERLASIKDEISQEYT